MTHFLKEMGRHTPSPNTPTILKLACLWVGGCADHVLQNPNWASLTSDSQITSRHVGERVVLMTKH